MLNRVIDQVKVQVYGQSVFADAVDAVQSVDLAYDALINEVDVDYFDFDKVGYVRTATEVSSDNSALMRNVRKSENALRKPITDVSRALMAYARAWVCRRPTRGTCAWRSTTVSSRTPRRKRSRTWPRSRPG